MAKYKLYLYEMRNLRYGPAEIEAESLEEANEKMDDLWSRGVLGDPRDEGCEIDIIAVEGGEDEPK